MIALLTEIFYASEHVLPALRLVFPNAIPSAFPLWPPLPSFPICVVHLQTCKHDHFPPALHHTAPLSAAGSNYQPCLTHKASVMMTETEI